MTVDETPSMTAAGLEGGGPPPGGPAILLVSPDLFTSSRIAGLARSVNGTLTTLRAAEQPTAAGPWEVVLVDLEALRGDPAAIVAGVLAGPARPRTEGGPRPRIIAFGPHVAKERLDRARAAGADAAVSRGEMLGDFAGVLVSSGLAPPSA